MSDAPIAWGMSPPPHIPPVPLAPLPPGHVRPDHYLRQFDRHPEGEPRLRAMAEHHAWCHNYHADQVRMWKAQVEGALEALRLGEVPAAIALDLAEFLRQQED